MRSAVVILSLVAAIAAEAPYHLPRPAPQAQQFNYPPAPVPPPPPPPPRPIPQFSPQFAPQPTPQPFNPGFGYQYQQPSIAPAFVQHAPAPAPAPIFAPAPQQQFQYQQPQPQPQPQNYPQPQPISHHQPQAYQPPSTSYGVPQQPQSFRAPAFQPAPQPQLIPQPQPSQVYQPINYNQQQFAQGGYSYQQPQAQQFQPQHIAQVPLQAQTLSHSAPALSSYQADTNQYSNDLTHREALDSVVVDRVQNIIRDSEHSSARSAGYQSLVSGVTLENARPSIEISSFVHSSPLISDQSTVPRGFSRNVSADVSVPSSNYGQPSISSSSQSSLSTSFLPQTKPASSYGPPN